MGARDVKAGPCGSYLESVMFQVVSKCLVRHSRRATSEAVCIHVVNLKLYNVTRF